MGDPAAGLHPNSVNVPSIHLDRNSELCIVGYNEARKARNRSPNLLLHQPGLAAIVSRLPLLWFLATSFMANRLGCMLRHAYYRNTHAVNVASLLGRNEVREGITIQKVILPLITITNID